MFKQDRKNIRVTFYIIGPVRRVKWYVLCERATIATLRALIDRATKRVERTTPGNRVALFTPPNCHTNGHRAGVALPSVSDLFLGCLQ